MTALPYQVVDAFTNTPFGGNQAAVVLFAVDDARSTSSTYQLSLAREFNFSETAFLTPLPTSTRAAPHFGLRWWTPVAEFPLCGHATLASAHVLFSTNYADAELVRFETMSGTLTAQKRSDGRLELDFPADASVLESKVDGAEERLMLAIGTLGIEGIEGMVRGWARGKLAWIVELDKSVQLASLELDVKGFKNLDGYIVFTQASSDPAYDILSRVLDPVEDIQEDPVTGSAHCALAPYWLGSPARARLTSKLLLEETDTLRARQVSARGGDLDVCWDRETGRAKLRGSAVTVMSGQIHA